MKKYVFGLSLLLASIAQAQPEKVIVHKDGTVEIVQHDPPLSAVEATVIEQVPVFSEQEDGSMVPGVFYSGFNQSGSHSHKCPWIIEKNNDGTWKLRYRLWLIHGDGPKIENRFIPRSDFAHIYDPSSAVDRDVRGVSIWVSYDHTGAPIGVDEVEMGKLASRLQFMYRQLFKDETVTKFIELKWVDISTSTGIAQAQASAAQYDYSFVRSRLNSQYLGDDIDSFEGSGTGIYNFLPLGSTIDYKTGSGTIIDSDFVYLTYSQINKFNQAVLPGTLTEEVYLNKSSDAKFDTDPSDKIDADSVDMMGTLVHEIGHIFGFLSAAEAVDADPSPTTQGLTVWDMYRFNETEFPSISLNDFSTKPRELRLGVPAHAKLHTAGGIHEGLSYAEPAEPYLPPGVVTEAGHWRSYLIHGGDPIGIMDPIFDNGYETGHNGVYLTTPDIKAFDLMGYTIDLNDFPEAFAVPIFPLPGITIPAVPFINFEWSSVSGVISTEFMIYDLGLASQNTPLQIPGGSLIYRNNTVSGNSLTVMSDEISLIPGHRYQWHAAIYHPMGVVLTEPATFTIDGEVSPISPCADQFESAKLLPPNGGDYYALAGSSVAISGDLIVVGADANKGGTEGRAYVYRRVASRWIYETTLTTTMDSHEHYFGGAVATDGDVIIVGAYGDNNQDGLVHIFRHDGTDWIEETVLSENNTTWFGRSLSLSGSTLVVGAPESDNAYIYEYSGGAWNKITELVPLDNNGDPVSHIEYGFSVSIDNDVVVIGANRDYSSNGVRSGTAYVYRFNGTTWDLEEKLSDSTLDSAAKFGYSVSVSNGNLVVGAVGADTLTANNTGAAFVYEYTNPSWTLVEMLEHDGARSSDHFGDSVFINGDIIAIGASYVTTNGHNDAGAAFTFQYDGTDWRRRNSLRASEASPTDYFGFSIAIDGNSIVVGSVWDSDFVEYSGSAYVYEFNVCPADIDESGTLDFFDISDFLSQYQAQTELSDWNCDGSWDFFDVSAFLDEYGAGCP